MFGDVRFKQTIKNKGEKSLKPENDEIKRLQMEYKKTAKEIRELLNQRIEGFKPYKDWE